MFLGKRSISEMSKCSLLVIVYSVGNVPWQFCYSLSSSIRLGADNMWNVETRKVSTGKVDVLAACPCA